MTEHALEPLVVPFAGERYREHDRLSDLIAPPYDVIPPARRKALGDRDPHNIVRVILPDGDAEQRYADAAALLAQWRDEGVLRADEEPGLYVVQQEFTTPAGERRTRTGFIGAVAVEPFSGGRVKAHERTHAGPKIDRLALLRATSTMCEALLMVTRDDDGQVSRLLERAVAGEPLSTAELDGVRIAVWQVTGRDADALAEASRIGPLYVADGHHRYETAIAYRQGVPAGARTLAVIVPARDPGLVILPTHRIVFGASLDVAAIIEGLRERFHIHELPTDVSYVQHLAELRDRGTACVVVQPDGHAVALLLKPGAKLGDLPFANEPTVASLDVARIDELVVKRLRSAAGDHGALEYSADADYVIEQVLGGGVAAGVLVNPTSLEQVLAVADAGSVMPQKATFFAPKVPSGLVLMRYDA
jgi:uncharacterized protein (DUF1015 family)